MSKRKVKVFSLRDKLKIIRAFEGGNSKRDILREFDLPKSTFYKILKFKDAIKLQCSEGHGNIKRCRLVEYPDLEKRLAEWIKEAVNKNSPIYGTLLKEKSKDIATKLGIQHFAASNGWLEGFKRRHDLRFKRIARKSESTKRELCDELAEDLTSLLEEYNLNDICNVVEADAVLKYLTAEGTNDNIFGYSHSMLMQQNCDDNKDGLTVSHLNATTKSIPRKQDVLSALATVHRYFELTADNDKIIFDKIYELESCVQNTNT